MRDFYRTGLGGHTHCVLIVLIVAVFRFTTSADSPTGFGVSKYSRVIDKWCWVLVGRQVQLNKEALDFKQIAL